MLSKIVQLLYTLAIIYPVLTIDDGEEDQVKNVPGFGDNPPRVFAGYIKARNNASLHYILVASQKGLDNGDPVTLWINSAPGCSSKIAFLSQIGPFLLPPEIPYNTSVSLSPNPYSWNKISNLLFIDSPQGTGYSLMTDESYIYNDQNTLDETFTSLLDFFTTRFPSLRTRNFYIAGSSYAGKFIPDLALRINSYNLNEEKKINLKGILVGNGIMELSDNQLEKNQIDYMFSRNFIDPTLDKYWDSSCQIDPKSAGCAFFLRRYDELLSKTNIHNIHGQCYKDPASLLLSVNKTALSGFIDKKAEYYNTLIKCQSRKGIDQYFQLNVGDFRGKNERFVSCNETLYHSYAKTEDGSMNQYARLISETVTRIHFYAGDWDDVVPFTYTLKHLGRLGMRQLGDIRPWINTTSQQHIGFKRTFVQGQRQIKFWMIKGAGQQITKSKPSVAYELFDGFLNNKQ